MSLSISSRQPVLEEPGPHGHLVQLYQADERVLSKNVAQYLREGLRRGEGLLVIATAGHKESFLQGLWELGVDPQAAVRDKQLVFIDAAETLAAFMVDSEPDWLLFVTTIGAAMVEVRPQSPHAGLRAYGEMVGLLWKAEQYSAAVRLEGFWNKLLESGGFRLYCAYPIDVFSDGFQKDAVDALLCAHTHLVPSGENGDVESALNRAMGEILGPDVEKLKFLMTNDGRPSWAMLPRAEAAILGLRNHAPGHANQVLDRARHHYQSEKRFRALVENSSDAIALLDEQGKVLYASPSTARVLGYGQGEFAGRDFLELIHPENAEEFRQLLRQILARPHTPLQLEARMRRKDGSWCWVESTTSNLLGESDIRSIVTNYRDITERKAAEEEKQRNAEELARSHAELQAFAYAATHDLQEPLRTVCAFTELLVQNTQLDKNGQEFAGLIVDGVKRMSGLLDDLLSFTRLSISEPLRRVELYDAAQQAIHSLGSAIHESGLTITIQPLPAVEGNERHLVQLFQNVIGNAIKYRSDAPIEVHITAEQLGRESVVRVKDNGIGIPPEYHDHVFGLFKRLHARETPGSGIGLAICRKIVDGMGGAIWIESDSGPGTTFCFRITEAKEPGAPERITSNLQPLIQ